MIKLKDIMKLIAEEKESGFKPLSDLEHAIEQNKKGSDYYDKTKLKNIFNQLSPEDQKEARSKYSKYIKENNKITNRAIGIHLSSIDLSVIIKSLEKSKLVDQPIIDQLKNKKNISNLMVSNASNILKSLKLNGKSTGLNLPALKQLMDKIQDLESGKSTFVDF